MSKRILFISPQPFFAERATPIRALQFLKAMTAAGYEVDLLCYPLGRDLDPPGVRIIRSPRVPGIRAVKVGPSLAKFPLDLLLAWKAFGLCRRTHYAVIDAIEESAFFAVWLKRIFRCKLIYHMDSLISEQLRYSGCLGLRNPLLGFATWLEKRTILHSDLAITVSDDIATKIIRKLPGQAIMVIEDAPLNETFPDVGEAAEALRKEFGYDRGLWIVVLYTGNYAGYQGVELLLESIALLKDRHPELRLSLVGDLPAGSGKLRSKVESLEIADRCQFVGVRPVDEIPTWLASADILVSPRIAGTNTPLKLYSYMQSPTPIVATNLPVHTKMCSRTKRRCSRNLRRKPLPAALKS